MTSPWLERAEAIASAADELGIEIAIIGAMALAAHNYVRGTEDLDFATSVDPRRDLPRLQAALESLGFSTRLNQPDDDDPLGGLLIAWDREDEEGDPVEPIEIVNFLNPHRRIANPGPEAIRNATDLDKDSRLRYVRLPDLVALKLYAGSLRDKADVVELLRRNPDAELSEIRAACRRFGYEPLLDELLHEARAPR